MNELLKTKDGKYIYICSVSSDYTTNDSVLVGAEEIKYFPKQCVVFLATYQEDFEDFVDGGVANENILFAVKARSRKALKEKILSDTSLVASGSKSFQGILDLFAGNVFWPYIAENRVRLNPNPNGGAFLSPTWDIGIPLSGEWIWNGSSVVSVSGSVFQNGIKEIYKGGMIRLCNDGQVNPWFVIEKIVWNGNSATIMIRPEGRNPPSGVGGVTEIKNYGQGATLGECFGGGYPSIGSYNALVTPTWVVDYQGNPWKEEIDLVTRANMCKPWNRDVMIINDDTPVLSVEALGNLPDGDTERYFGGNICVNLNFPTFGGFAPDVSTGFPEANENLGALSDDTPYPVESSVVWPTGSVDGIASVLVNNPSEFVMGHVMNASTYVAEKTRPIEMIRMDQDTRDWTGRDISTPGYGWFSIVDVGRRDVESENLLFSETELDTHEAILSSSFGALPIADVDKSGVLEVIGGENEGLHDRWSGKWTFVRTPNGYTKIKLFIPFDVSSTYILRNFEVYTGEIKIKVDDRIVPTTTNESTYSRSIRGGMTYGIPHAKHVVYTDIFSFETGFDPLATWIAVAERVEEDGLDSYTAFFDAPSPITKDYDKIKKLYKSALEQFKKANCIVPAAMVNAFGQNHSSSSSLPKLLWSLADFN
ncbi:MAG: hypothetical protein Q8P81_04385, partial [Nanoarchaeota archaeon]|nr:hypothetical protein [Nanoarchaeota archaeon]